MNMFLIIIFVSYFTLSSCANITVKNSSELKAALLEVNPGDTIHLSDGLYNDKFVASRSGKKGSPITLSGSKKAILSSSSYGFNLKADYWVLSGFTVSDSKKGIVLDGANFNVLEKLSVHNIDQEAIHFRTNSADNILRDSEVSKTGLTDPGFGEGVYIGSAVSNWVDGKPDLSDRNQILNNKIGPNVAAECIDIKEGTTGGIIKGNTFDGTGMSGENSADSWIDVKGEKYTIEDNTGSKSLLDGIQIHYVSNAKMGGCHHVIRNNKCSGLPSGGQCVANTIKDNTITKSGDCPNTISNNV